VAGGGLLLIGHDDQNVGSIRHGLLLSGLCGQDAGDPFFCRESGLTVKVASTLR
jgi:hypothetical protein